MTAPETVAVMEAISPGDSDQARFVGGCVRNALQGVVVEDVDIATRLEPHQTVEALQAVGLKAVPTGLDHGTITAVSGGRPYEITTLRRDVETDGRHAIVRFSTDWREDAARRDFRLNAIYASRTGEIFDPFNGVADAQERRVVFIGDPVARLEEDVLRILRFYRFNAWYGAGLDPAGHAACQALASRLTYLAAERVWKELKKLLLAPDPGDVIQAMHKGHVLAALWPGALDLNLFLSLINRDRAYARPADPVLRAVALSGQDERTVQDLCEQMKASRAERNRMAAMAGALPVRAGHVTPGLSEIALARAAYVLGAETVCDRMRLAEARGEGEAAPALRAMDNWCKPQMPVGGRDLIAQGMARGPQLGVMLEALEELWIESGFALTREDLLQHAAEARS